MGQRNDSSFAPSGKGKLFMHNFSNASTFYVSQAAGNSRYSGLTPQPDQNGNGPLPSLEQALRKIRELRRGGMKQPVSIKIMDSVYTLKQTLVIDETTDAVTIESFGASPATISGGRRITGFTRATFRGIDCFAAFIPEVKSGSGPSPTCMWTASGPI